MINKVSGLFGVYSHNNLNFCSRKQKSKASEIAKSNVVELPLGNIYGAKINPYTNNDLYNEPAQRLYRIVSSKNELEVDNYTLEHLYSGVGVNDKYWVGGVSPSELLNRTTSEAINSILTLAGISSGNKYKTIPANIKTPYYGDNWGRYANYIEINNRTLGKMEWNKCSESILGAIRLLPAIPPSHKNYANCVILSQIFPNIYGDGYSNNGENSLYTDMFEYERLSDTIGTVGWGDEKIGPEDQVRAFNDLAHLRGLKTGFRVVLGEDQLRVGMNDVLRWDNPNHQEAFILACVKAINLGFDAIFFDGAKHVGGHAKEFSSTIVGKTPEYEQMKYILREIKRRTGRNDISFIGEMCNDNPARYSDMGLSAGSGSIDLSGDINYIKNFNRENASRSDFAPGGDVTNDNDGDWGMPLAYEQRQNRLNNALFGYDNPSQKPPVFIQMADLFPLNYGTSTHNLMLSNPSFADGDCTTHWKNLFANGEVEVEHRRKMGEIFANSYAYPPN